MAFLTYRFLYKNMLLLANLMLFFNFGHATELELRMRPQGGPVFLGDQVEFSCVPHGTRNKLYPLVFKGPSSIVSEKCMVYNDQRYTLRCDPPGWDMAQRFHFTILNVSWSDRGIWHCMDSGNSTQQHLEVYIPRPIHSSVKVLQNPTSTVGQQQPFSEIPLEGAGLREFPYRLQSTKLHRRVTLQVKCHIPCTYPVPQLRWKAFNGTANITLASMPLSKQPSSQEMCDSDVQTRGMTWTEEMVHVNCATFPLTGRSEITCTAIGPQYQRRSVTGDLLSSSTDNSHFSVFILCPDRVRVASLLTEGEITAIAVGTVLACLLLLLAGLISRRHRQKPTTTCPVPMPRISNISSLHYPHHHDSQTATLLRQQQLLQQLQQEQNSNYARSYSSPVPSLQGYSPYHMRNIHLL